jgi:SAM-dependent methyltransferase
MPERNGFYKVLRLASVYSLWQSIVGSPAAHKKFVAEYLQPQPGEKILDLGCGPGDFLQYLPEYVNYFGCDPNRNYIKTAQNRYKKRGNFWQAGIDAETGLIIPSEVPVCDTVLSMAVFHHLDERQSLQLLRKAQSIVKQTDNGRFVIFDNCLTTPQNKIASWLINHDRGRYPKTDLWFKLELEQLFGKVTINLRTNLLRIPYTIVIIECRL